MRISAINIQHQLPRSVVNPQLGVPVKQLKRDEIPRVVIGEGSLGAIVHNEAVLLGGDELDGGDALATLLQGGEHGEAVAVEAVAGLLAARPREARQALAAVGDQSGEREREMFYLTMHSTHFIYGYMASDIWLRTILIVRKETRCRHIGYSYRLTARVLLYAPSNRQDSKYHSLCYTSRGALAGTRNSSMGRVIKHAGVNINL